MSDAIARYRAAIRAELAGVPGADDTVAELEDHLREATDALIARGRPPAVAAQESVERLGSPALIGRRIRAEHGRPRPHDPAPGHRWPFTVAEILLILAAVSAVAATYVHWLPCGGDAITPRAISDACLTRMDAAWAFPFAPEAGERDPLADGFRLVGLLLMALAWLVFTVGQPWRPLNRLVIALPIVPLLAMAADTASLMADPSAEPQWWAQTPILWVVDGLAIFAMVAVIDAPPYGRPDRVERAIQPTASMTYDVFGWRVALLLLAVSAPGFSRFTLDFSIMVGISELDWDTPPGTGYLTAALLGAPALASAVLGIGDRLRASRAAEPVRQPAEEGQAGPSTLFPA